MLRNALPKYCIHTCCATRYLNTVFTHVAQRAGSACVNSAAQQNEHMLCNATYIGVYSCKNTSTHTNIQHSCSTDISKRRAPPALPRCCAAYSAAACATLLLRTENERRRGFTAYVSIRQHTSAYAWATSALRTKNDKT